MAQYWERKLPDTDYLKEKEHSDGLKEEGERKWVLLEKPDAQNHLHGRVDS